MPEEQEPFSDVRSMVFKLCSTLISPWRRQCLLWGHGMTGAGASPRLWALGMEYGTCQGGNNPPTAFLSSQPGEDGRIHPSHHTDMNFHKGIFVLTKCGPKVFLQLPCFRPGITSTTNSRGMELRMTQKFRKTQ